MRAKLSFFVALFLCVSASAQKPQIGKSMGRWKDFSLQSMIENKAQGLDYIEVTMNNVIKKNPENVSESAAQIMADIQASGLKVWSVHLPYSRKLDISVLDSSARAENVQYVASMMRIASVFEPTVFVLHPSSEPIDEEQREQRLNNSHNSIGVLASVADELGITLCVENLPRTCLGRNGGEMTRLIEGYPNVGLCFDTNHLLYQSHEDYLNSIPQGKIKTVHLSDYDFQNERHYVPGDGQIAWPSLWQGIKKNGYEGIMMFECYLEPERFNSTRNLILQGYMSGPAVEDSLALANASWQTTRLKKGAEASYCQVNMFNSTQSISVVKYNAKKFRTALVYETGDRARTVPVLCQDKRAELGVNACYFNVKAKYPSVYSRVGNKIIARTSPNEVFRVNGVVALKNKRGHKFLIAPCDTSQYESVAGNYYSALASGPLLINDNNIVVPLVTGTLKGSNAAGFYDNRHPRSVIGLDNEGNVYYVVIDGRFPGKGDGASIFEAAVICKLLGMNVALNLDGGGSSTVWTSESGVLNYPYDNKTWDHEGCRIVPNAILAW